MPETQWIANTKQISTSLPHVLLPPLFSILRLSIFIPNEQERRFKISHWVSKMCLCVGCVSLFWPCGNVQTCIVLFHCLCFHWRKEVINNLNGSQTEFNYLCHPIEMNKSQYVLLFYLHVPGEWCLHFHNFETLVCSLCLAWPEYSFNQILIWHNT